MSLNAEPLLKIVALESEKGYKDSAVIGGLDRFLKNWSAKAAESIASPKELTRFKRMNLANSKYASLTTEQRRELLDNLLNYVKAMESATPPAEAAATKQTIKKTPLIKPSTPRIKKTIPATDATPESTISIVKGISEAQQKKFEKLGVRTIRDLLYFFPNRHLDYSQRKTISQLTVGNEETIVANVWQTREVRPGGRRSTEAIVGDETGNIVVTWFNNPYLVKQLGTNSRIAISGKVSVFQGRHVFQSPEWELLEDKELIHTGRFVPVYPLTQGLYPRQVRKLMKETIDRYAGLAAEFLPLEIRTRCEMLELGDAIHQAHFPISEAEKDKARTRLAFDELFLLQLGVLRKKQDWQESQPSHPILTDRPVLEKFLKSLPFALTEAQRKALQELLADISKPKAMSRLLQGDVGSGKTVVAAAALLMCAAGGWQSALMAPTEILASQHFSTIRQLLSRAGETFESDDYSASFTGILSRPISAALLIGAMPAKKKQEIQKRLKNGEVDIIIGTHALIQKDVSFAILGMAVIDEQHRFGVEQRSALRQKGFNPHLAVMTATPIPRTLALTLYGDLDLSVINEMPPGRLPVKTRWLKPNQRDSGYAFIRKQIADGHQAFIICPLVEESETVQARAATAEYEYLSSEVFPQYRLGLIHGRISATEKDDVMRRFHSGELNILVATPVIEVGIDVPNATVMLVESADRFGLSQLHQFRGRVGRGAAQSYCMLLAENPSEVGQQRLDIIETVHDGFRLAEEDLKLRGPGEFFGTRQSGLPDLKMARLSDVAILERARAEAIRLFEQDKTLSRPEHQQLAQEVVRVWADKVEGGRS